MKTQWITHKNKKILLADYSGLGLDTQAAKAEMAVAIKLARQEPLNSVLTLTDVNGTKGSPEMFALMRDTAAQIGPHAQKRALVGVSRVQMTFLNLINKASSSKPFIVFDDLENAKNWLVE